MRRNVYNIYVYIIISGVQKSTKATGPEPRVRDNDANTCTSKDWNHNFLLERQKNPVILNAIQVETEMAPC